MPIRVALVDDDPLARTAIAGILAAHEDLEVAGEAGDGDEVLDLVRRCGPDVLLMDLRMRRLDGVSATALARALPRPPEVLVLTTWDVDDNVMRALAAGASGFLLKTAAPMRIVDAIRAVARGDAVLSPESTRHVIDAALRDESRQGRDRARRRLALLGERELAVARLVAEGRSNDEIGRALHLAPGTVKQHLAAIGDKLEVRGRVLLAVLVATAGYGPRW